MAAEWWPAIAGGLSLPWSHEAVLMDLRWWAARERMGDGKRPGRPALIVRWGWTDYSARAAMLDVAGWQDPERPAETPRTVSRVTAPAEPPDFDSADCWSDAERATHAALVSRAVVFLRRHIGCKIVAAEASAGSPVGRPDGIGWQSRTGACHHIEVKVSRADFRRDHKKVSHLADRVIGDFRWYMTPPGLLTAADIPAGWGLVEAKPRGFRVVVEAPRVTPTDGALQDERSILTGLIRASQYGSILDETTGRLA